MEANQTRLADTRGRDTARWGRNHCARLGDRPPQRFRRSALYSGWAIWACCGIGKVSGYWQARRVASAATIRSTRLVRNCSSTPGWSCPLSWASSCTSIDAPHASSASAWAIAAERHSEAETPPQPLSTNADTATIDASLAPRRMVSTAYESGESHLSVPTQPVPTLTKVLDLIPRNAN